MSQDAQMSTDPWALPLVPPGQLPTTTWDFGTSATTFATSAWGQFPTVLPPNGQLSDTLNGSLLTPAPPYVSGIPLPPPLPSANTIIQHIPSAPSLNVPVSERTKIIDEFYLVLGHKVWLDPAKIYALHSMDLEGCIGSTTSQSKKRPEDSFRYLDLPKEIQRKVLTALFRDCRHELGYHSTVRFWHPCAVRRALLATSTTCIEQDTCHLGLALPEDFVQMFVSRDFMADALPIFAKYTTIDIWHFHVHNILPLLCPFPMLEHVFSVLLANTNCLAIEDWNLSKTVSPYALTLTNWTWKIKVLDVHTEAPLLWKTKSRYSSSDKIIWDHKHGLKWPSLHIIEYLDWLRFASTIKYPPNLKDRLKKGLAEDRRYRNMKRLGRRLNIDVRLRVMFACKVKERWTGPVAGIAGLNSCPSSVSASIVLEVMTSEIIEVNLNTHIYNSIDRMWKYEHAAAEFLCGQTLPHGVRGGCRNMFLLRSDSS